MNIIKEIDGLPDYMEPAKIADWFKRVLELYNEKEIDKKETLNALFGLADRQWHTYEILNENTKSSVEEWVISNWESTSEFIDNIAGTIGHLGLSKAYQKIIDLSRDSNIPAELKLLVEEIVKEFGDSVENPYKT